MLNGIEMVAMFCAFGFRSKLQSKTKLPNILLHTIIDKKELIMRKKRRKKYWERNTNISHTKIYCIFFFSNNLKMKCLLFKILNLNVNSRMKIYWIKNHVKQTIKKSQKISIVSIAFNSFFVRLFLVFITLFIAWKIVHS